MLVLLSSPASHWIPRVPSSALLFMLFGGVLFLCARMPSSRASRRVAIGIAALKAKLLSAIAKGDLILGVAWQAQLGGLNPMTIATTAVAQPSGSIVLNGAKRFVAPAAGADLAIPHWLSRAGYPALAIPHWLSCAGYPALAILLLRIALSVICIFPLSVFATG